MPIAQRTVEPVFVFQNRSLAQNVPSSLPSTSLIALTSLIRQLSGVSKFADEMFGEVFNEVTKFAYRCNRMDERVASLTQTLQDKKADEALLVPDMAAPEQEKPEQHILNVYIPRALKEKYHTCDRPPPLGIFARLRPDGRDGMSLYTDPTLFFRQWLYNMNREANVLRNPNKKRMRRSRSMRGGQMPYIAPPSSSPPPPLAYPVYENRDSAEDTPGDNIYEMLPDQVTENTPPSHDTAPIPRQRRPATPPLLPAFNQSVTYSQSHDMSLPEDDPHSPRHDEERALPPPTMGAELSREVAHRAAHRNKSYDLSMQHERLISVDSTQYEDSRMTGARLETVHQRVEMSHHNTTGDTSHLQNSLTSLTIDTPSRISKSPAAQMVQPQSTTDHSSLYDNHNLTSHSITDSRGFVVDPNDVPFSMDDLPPPPEDLLEATTSFSTPHKQFVACSPPPDSSYDPLPGHSARYHVQTTSTPGNQSPLNKFNSENQSQISNFTGNQSPVSNFTGNQSPISNFTGNQSPMSNFTGNQSPVHPAPPIKAARTVTRKQTPPANSVPAKSKEGPKNDLLEAIRTGINLKPTKRTVEKSEPAAAQQQPALFHDVASILQRRKFLIGDMCDGSSDSSGDSDGAWDDEDDSWN